AAAEAGAAALIVCEPDSGRPLTAIPGGAPGIPVIGLRGSAAMHALDLTPRDGGLAFISAPRARAAPGPVAAAATSSRGPTYALAPKPDLAAPGTAALGGTVVAGTSVAAARVAAAAVRLHADRPAERPDDLIAALVGTARPVGPPLAAGAGRVELAQAMRAAVLIEPGTLALPRQEAATPFTVSKTFVVHNTYSATEHMSLTVSVPGLAATVTPATLDLARNGRQAVTLSVTAAGRGHAPGWVGGRLTARGSGITVSAPIGLPVGPVPPARLGPLALAASGGRTDGVRFTAGAVTTRAGVRSVEPLGNLRLELVDASGNVVRELTPAGGAPDLLPGEYAYTLTRSARSGLAGGSYSFVAHGRAPAGGPEVTRKSPSFAPR
ncbi:MAG: hypothetical protein QOF55_1832, partial [Thermoleophilaceae bacterium]|nr:hypothetical protein [Thermoleophilaceae bacterium]